MTPPHITTQIDRIEGRNLELCTLIPFFVIQSLHVCVFIIIHTGILSIDYFITNNHCTIGILICHIVITIIEMGSPPVFIKFKSPYHHRVVASTGTCNIVYRKSNRLPIEQGIDYEFIERCSIRHTLGFDSNHIVLFEHLGEKSRESQNRG